MDDKKDNVVDMFDRKPKEETIENSSTADTDDAPKEKTIDDLMNEMGGKMKMLKVKAEDERKKRAKDLAMRVKKGRDLGIRR